MAILWNRLACISVLYQDVTAASVLRYYQHELKNFLAGLRFLNDLLKRFSCCLKGCTNLLM